MLGGRSGALSLFSPKRSILGAFERSTLGVRLGGAPPPPPSFERVVCTWDYVNAATNVVPSDLCTDRAPPDPTPGPDRPDLGSYTHTSRFRLVTQCFIPDWIPGYQMTLVIKAGQPDETELDFDVTQNGYPWEAFSNYDPGFSWARNYLYCQAVLPGSPVLPDASADGGATGAYSPVATVQGFEHRWEIWHWDNVTLPTVFGDPLALDIPLQAPKSITAFSTVGFLVTATAPAHGLECGSAVYIFDADTPPTERLVRIEAVTANSFTWDYRFYGGDWTGLTEGQWLPSYNASIDHHSRCP